MGAFIIMEFYNSYAQSKHKEFVSVQKEILLEQIQDLVV